MAMFWSICSRQRVQQYTGSCSISFNGSRLVDLYMIPRGNLDSQPQMPCLDEIAMKSLYLTEEYKNFDFDLAAIPKYEGVMWQRMRAQCSSFNAWIILKCRWSKMDSFLSVKNFFCTYRIWCSACLWFALIHGIWACFDLLVQFVQKINRPL